MLTLKKQEEVVMNKKSGFTLLEILIVCSMVIVLSSYAYLPINDRMNKTALMEAKSKIEVTLNNISNKSFNYGNIYDIKMDFENKNIIISKDEIVLEIIKLPKNLEYEDINGKKIINRKTTSKGNMSKSFSIYITDKKKRDIFYRITVDTTSIMQIIFIRKYKPTDKITAYNYKNEKYHAIVWKKE
jgi:hypothetical protein